MGELTYRSSGSEQFDVTDSACLGEMVAQFMEESGAEGQPLETLSPARTQTETIHDANNTEDCETVHQSQQQFEILKGIISSSCPAELDLLAETCKLSLEMDLQQPECVKQFVMCHLRNVGYDAAICKSQPKDNSRAFSPGNYEYMDVILKSTNSGRSIRLFVDLDFRAQFEIARPTSEYSALLGLLPKIYVGRAHKLDSILKIMCEGVKNSLMRRGMHIPPWRKYKYMHSRWLDSYKRTAACNSVLHDSCKNNMTNPESSPVTDLMTMEKHVWNTIHATGNVEVADQEYLNWYSPVTVLSCKPSTGKFIISTLSCALMEAGLTSLQVKTSTRQYLTMPR